MKTFYIILIIIFTAGTYSAMAQNADLSNPDCMTCYKSLKNLHIKKLKSSKEYFSLVKVFMTKMNIKNQQEYKEEISADILGWIKLNVDKTFFENYEAAENEYNSLEHAESIMFKDSKEYFAYQKECRKFCDDKVIINIHHEVKREHPELIICE